MLSSKYFSFRKGLLLVSSPPKQNNSSILTLCELVNCSRTDQWGIDLQSLFDQFQNFGLVYFLMFTSFQNSFDNIMYASHNSLLDLSNLQSLFIHWMILKND